MWWLILLRGICLIIFGLLAMAWPGITLITLAMLFSVYVFVSGVINIIQGIVSVEKYRYWFLVLALGVLEIAAGAYALTHPLISIATLALLIGFMFSFRGILEIIAAFDIAYSGSMRTYFIIVGILGLIAGVVVLIYPVAGGLAFTWVLGVYALIAGAILVASSITLQNIAKEVLR